MTFEISLVKSEKMAEDILMKGDNFKADKLKQKSKFQGGRSPQKHPTRGLAPVPPPGSPPVCPYILYMASGYIVTLCPTKQIVNMHTHTIDNNNNNLYFCHQYIINT